MLNFRQDVYEKLFRSFDNNAVIMRVEEDAKYYPIWCSKEFTEMMEGTEEDFIRLENGGTMNTIHPDDRKAVAYLFRNHKAEDGKNHLTFRKKTVKGNELWVCVHYSFFEEDGKQYAYCSYFDVTDLKISQEQTRMMYDELDDELNALADECLAALRFNLSTGVVEKIRGRDLYRTDRVGASLDNILKIRTDNMPILSDVKKYLDLFDTNRLRESYLAGKTSASEVIFTQRPSGRQCFIKFTASVRKEPINGDLIVLGTETEYNSQKVTEVINHKVLASQYDMVSYIVGDNYGVVIGDASSVRKGNIFPKYNYGVYSDYINDQVIPAAASDIHDKEQLREQLSLKRVVSELSGKEPYAVDVTCEIDGEIYHKRFTFYVLDSEARFYIVLKADMTDVLREQRERNELLENALEEANRANAAKTSFLSSMSHEIRTPMNAIIGLDTIALKDPSLSAQTREYLEKIGGSASHLLGLINDILDMSRIESGRMTIKNEEFSFGDMLGQINTMINGQCRDKGLSYDCIVKTRVDPYYIGDDMKLKQVLINILGNAIKFTPAPGSVTLNVERAAQFEDKTVMRFTVKDTGIGMNKEFIPRIFEAFSQENENLANKYGSTGLGMAITKNIVELMNGDISAVSEKGKGTEFTVTVTFNNSERRDEQENDLRPQDFHVLIIDDDPVACEHAKLILSEVGITADTALGCDHAIEMIKLKTARREEYNLMLVDMKMPERDGINTTKRIREVTGSDHAVIILTAYSWDDIADKATKAGIDSFMAKPLFASGLMGKLNRVIRKKNNGKKPSVNRAELKGKRILLAEDVMINAEIMKRLLKMRGMLVEHGENGSIVSKMFAQSEPGYYSAVLMDVRMPVMDGLAATKAIRALDRPDAKAIPIIAMTANAFDEDVQLSLQAGMNAHLSKPVEPDHLYDTLEILIKDTGA